MQQWHQLTFDVKISFLEMVEDYLFINNAGSITTINKSDKEVSLTTLYENHHDIKIIIANLKEQFGGSIISEINYEIIKDQQWEAAWLYDYEPINIGKNMVVYPNWHKLPPQDNKHIYIVVDPSIAFGCGNHETTKMCLEWLENHVSNDTQVLDYGCGTGVLAIGAVKLGAIYAEGIDIDLNSIESSQKNAQENKVANKTYFSDNLPTQKFDLIVANIFSNILISLAKIIVDSLKKGGKLALSGIIENQVTEVQKEFMKYGITFNNPRQMGQWFLLDGIKNGL